LTQTIEAFVTRHNKTAEQFVWRKREVRGAQPRNTVVNLRNYTQVVIFQNAREYFTPCVCESNTPVIYQSLFYEIGRAGVRAVAVFHFNAVTP
jgi:hypothetical protein